MKVNNRSEDLLARCPRCGYDLHGAIDTWTDACPLTGVCSECGLEFIWSEVLCPEKYEPLWCVEFSNAGSLKRSALKTYLMSFRPWRFWRELKMSNDVRWRRLLLYVLLLVLPLLSLYVIEQSVIAIQVWRSRQRLIVSVQKQTQAFIPRFQNSLDNLMASVVDLPEKMGELQARINALKAEEEAKTGQINQERQSLNQILISMLENQYAEIQTRNEVAALNIAGLQAQINSLKTQGQKPGSINFTLTKAIIEAVVFPLRRYSNGVIAYPQGNQPYPAPMSLHAIVLQQTQSFSRSRKLNLPIRQTIRSMIMQAMLLPGIPLAFLLLPISRQIAKMRWFHIVRVFLYSLFMPVTLLCILAVLFATGTFISPLESVTYKLGFWLFDYGIWVALIVWWALATRHYLKMPHGWVIAILFALMIALLTASVLFITVPSLMIDV